MPNLLCTLQALIQMPRWKKKDGADFVFYDPHPGFATGRAEMPIIDMACNTFKHSMHIIAERSQRNVCQTYWTMADKLLIAPYVPATSDVAKPLKVANTSGKIEKCPGSAFMVKCCVQLADTIIRTFLLSFIPNADS